MPFDADLMLRADRTVTLDYTNHRGERRTRRVLPAKIWFGSTEFHPEPQWLLQAYDLEKGKDRDFAIKGIHGWT